MKQINLFTAAIVLIAMTSIFTACGDSDTFTDPRDGQKYKTVKIGEKVWMADELKYKGNDSYTWDEALAACPEGWHLPSKSEIETVVADTSLGSTWSSTEKEDFSLNAYVKEGNKISSAIKTGNWSVRCVQGKGEEQQRLQEINGHKAIRVGNQIWMSDNLSIKTPNSICYLDDESECSSGRFYPFSEAINVCPEGWRLPSKSEAAKFINKLIKENSGLKQTRGYYIQKDEKFEDHWGEAMLWTSSYGYVMRHEHLFKPEIWEGRVFIKSENWKLAVRCIADSEDKKEELSCPKCILSY
uniref:FISUMP domain-containing protein n=1 Tax=Fibrobacter sp. TaxID=35828 RepID=UPI0025C4E861|nr:FISUMP domain-containing protein [Fibrobacter sp.]